LMLLINVSNQFGEIQLRLVNHYGFHNHKGFVGVNEFIIEHFLFLVDLPVYRTHQIKERSHSQHKPAIAIHKK
jgi:hypothetical protein